MVSEGRLSFMPEGCVFAACIRPSVPLLTWLELLQGNQVKEIQGMESNALTTLARIINKKEQKGVTTVEYAVMLVLVAIAVLAFGKGIANSITAVFSSLASSLQ